VFGLEKKPKDLVDGAPRALKKVLAKGEAEKMKEKLERSRAAKAELSN